MVTTGAEEPVGSAPAAAMAAWKVHACLSAVLARIAARTAVAETVGFAKGGSNVLPEPVSTLVWRGSASPQGVS